MMKKWRKKTPQQRLNMNYDTTAMILAGNEISFAIAADLIRLHMPSGK